MSNPAINPYMNRLRQNWLNAQKETEQYQVAEAGSCGKMLGYVWATSHSEAVKKARDRFKMALKIGCRLSVEKL
jgi:hypothetical protein